MDVNSVTVLIVNYNTPKLLRDHPALEEIPIDHKMALKHIVASF